MICAGHADNGTRAGASEYEIAAEVKKPGMASGVCNPRAAVSRAEASPFTAASRSVAKVGQLSGTRKGLKVETRRFA